jgi:site-specific DNA-methyltransferase (adenine-specific)/modification methylase
MMPDPWREKWVSPCGRAICYLGDNREVWPTLARPDAIVSDPPYGQRYVNISSGGSKNSTLTGVKASAGRFRGATIIGDDAAPHAAWCDAADTVLLWGAHRAAHLLPAGTWLIWDKRDGSPSNQMGDAECAWLNDHLPRAVRLFRFLWNGICRAPGDETARQPGTGAMVSREHPTQKPVALMAWCLDQAKVQPGQMVADPFMGSGTTGVACMRHGARFVGIEIDEGYFRTACRRIAEAARQPDLLIAETHA